MDEYRHRLADKELKETLDAMGTVVIVGPKWCDKTTTVEQVAKSSVYMQDPMMVEEFEDVMKIKHSTYWTARNPV